MIMEIDEKFNHRVLSFACLMFGTNVAMCVEPWLSSAWLCVLLTSIYHHHMPHVRVLIWLDRFAVYHLVLQNGRCAMMFCPLAVQLFYTGTVAYSAIWYYAAHLFGYSHYLRLRLHLIMYFLTSASGHFICMNMKK